VCTQFLKNVSVFFCAHTEETTARRCEYNLNFYGFIFCDSIRTFLAVVAMKVSSTNTAKCAVFIVVFTPSQMPTADTQTVVDFYYTTVTHTSQYKNRITKTRNHLCETSPFYTFW